MSISHEPPQAQDIKLTIYVDTNCAWCYIAEKEIARAMEQLKRSRSDIDFEVEYKPFIVDPCLPLDRCIDKQVHIVNKYGMDKVMMTQNMLKARGEQIGIHFKFGGMLRQSILSHRLLKRAYQIGGGKAQQAIISEICRKVFEEESDVGCISMLSDCAVASGLMCKEQAIAFLTSDQLKEEVQQDIMDARKKGIVGVPFAVINEKYAVCGGQTAEIYSQAFEKVVRHEVL